MKEGPDISRIASLIGDPARSNILLALMDGRALTAGELSVFAGVTKQTTSSHLAQLLAGGLLARDVQGRHHYYRLKEADVGHAIEALMGVAEKCIGKRARTGPKEPALRKSRICYDHLAGELGVLQFDKMLENGWLSLCEKDISLTQEGWKALGQIGIGKSDFHKSRRPLCKSCLDWSARRHHLAGLVGKTLLNQFFVLGWAKRLSETRIIKFTVEGEVSLRRWLDQASTLVAYKPLEAEDVI